MLTAHSVRLWCGVVAAAVMYLLLSNIGDDVWKAGVLAVVWFAAAWVGVKLRFLRRLLRGRAELAVTEPVTWTASVVCAALAVTVGSLVLYPLEDLAKTWDSLAVSTSICYVGAKAGCIILGCCQGEQKCRLLYGARLPAGEALATTACLAPIGVLVHLADGVAFVVFVIIHIIVRRVSINCRRPVA